MSLRQPKLRPLLRIIAAGCLLLWLLATSYCGMEHLFESSQHSRGKRFEGEVTIAASPRASAQRKAFEHTYAAKAQRSEQSKRGSDRDDDEDGVCCSTLHATATSPPQTLPKPDLHLLDVLTISPIAPAPIADASEDLFERHARSREWVFTPEVSLGPAFRSLAPPVFSLS